MASASPTLGDLFDSFEREAFRLETLDDYSRSGNTDAYRAFMAGDGQPEDYNAHWVEELRTHTGRGKRVYRVHVLTRPLEGVPDFWLFDSEHAAAMRYDDRGAFLGAAVAPPGEVADFIGHRDKALAHAEPFTI